jgi:hypothetical protein
VPDDNERSGDQADEIKTVLPASNVRRQEIVVCGCHDILRTLPEEESAYHDYRRATAGIANGLQTPSFALRFLAQRLLQIFNEIR